MTADSTQVIMNVCISITFHPVFSPISNFAITLETTLHERDLFFFEHLIDE